MPGGEELIERARRLADEVLFPSALATDRAGAVPIAVLDALAAAGFYGLTCPLAVGGLGADPATVCAVVEHLASGCLSTTFVWLQHLGAAAAVALGVGPLHDRFATALATGTCRSGVAFAHLRRPGPPAVIATSVAATSVAATSVAASTAGGAWVLNGEAPWVSGWDRIDVVHVAARCGDDVVWLLVDAIASGTMQPHPLPLAAVDATATVAIAWRDHPVPAERVVAIEPFSAWTARDALGLRTNGSLALGVARRACTLLGTSPLDEELEAVRSGLDAATGPALAPWRGAATDLAWRATGALVAATGGRAVVVDHPTQRLAREALFLLVQGQTPAIKADQLDRLTAPSVFSVPTTPIRSGPTPRRTQP